jgi:hypothetical protein
MIHVKVSRHTANMFIRSVSQYWPSSFKSAIKEKRIAGGEA